MFIQQPRSALLFSRAYIFYFTAPLFFIFTAGVFFCRFAPKSAPLPPMLPFFTPIPAKINNPFTSFISPIAPLPLIYLAQTRFPSLAKAKGMGNQVKRLCIFIESRIAERARILQLLAYIERSEIETQSCTEERIYSLLCSLLFGSFSSLMHSPSPFFFKGMGIGESYFLGLLISLSHSPK